MLQEAPGGCELAEPASPDKEMQAATTEEAADGAGYESAKEDLQAAAAEEPADEPAAEAPAPKEGKSSHGAADKKKPFAKPAFAPKLKSGRVRKQHARESYWVPAAAGFVRSAAPPVTLHESCSW